MPTLTVTTRNARFQQWQALLSNRTKRQREGAFLVQGVRPITMVVNADLPIRELLFNADVRLSAWARTTLAAVRAPRFALAADLVA
jgi:TrmH family RNA methyltransferase